MQTKTHLRLIQEENASSFVLVSEDRSSYYAVKRTIDIALSAVLLVLLLSLMILIAAMIFVYSPGPIFFIQERVGAKRQFDGSHNYWKRVNFRCYKFRTMKLNADSSIHQAYIKALIANNEVEMRAIQEAATRPTGKLDKNEVAVSRNAPTRPRKLVNDARVIAPGRILRKLSLDELPQLWNVLRGDMSLIGPRPAIPYEVEMYKPWHHLRLQAQPGLSGLQQVTARCTGDFDEQVRLDVEYIQKQSIWLDLKIILLTPLAILSTKGAQ